MSSNKTPNETQKEQLSGKQKRREKNRQIREIRSHNKTDNILSQDIPNISGPIDASKFAMARISEINSMQSAIKKASYALNELAFQSLPRGLRRRTASHNLNRLPARLRAKAAKETFQSSSNATLKRKKVRKIKRPVKLVDEYLRRQKTKKWLETHMWHTKRMKMTNIWGYRIASKPNVKSSRITYKSFTRLCIAHDASYMACVELKGQFNDIGKALNTITDLGLPSVMSERYIKGNRIGHSNLYEHLGYPTKLICPISFLWKPSNDVLWLWIHPSAYHEALQFIQQSIHEQQLTVEINDLRQEILRFELIGPRSTALLQTVLDPVSDEKHEGNKLWKDLKSLRSSCSLSPGSVIGLLVNDPRLNETRKSLIEKKITEYALNQRRENNLVPGTKLEPTPEDGQIPLLLFQRGAPVYQQAGITNCPLSSSELIEGWTLILPRGWGMAFWKSLIFAGARVAGFEDMRAMHFETGHSYFPHDFPGTRAFEIQRELVRKEAEEIWKKKPPAKRINFAKRGIEHPFECAFESLGLIDHMVIDQPEGSTVARPTYSLLHGAPLRYHLDDLNTRLNALVAKRGLNFVVPELRLDETLAKIRLKYIDRGKPMANAMIYLVDDQEVYEHCTHHIRTSSSSPLKTKRKLNELLEAEKKNVCEKISNYIPSKSQHIGYITNGNFSFSLGHGFGIGACTLNGLKRMEMLDAEQNRSVKRLVVVRNTTSLKVRAAQLEILA
ncbi:hypothetical protein G6F54_002681 [Rhizopus delemar]|nr:hypothetical protein G6F54_002681 [Rhizopus delemar]